MHTDTHTTFFYFLVVGKAMTKKKLVPGSIPTINMPQKSHARVNVSRPARSIVQDVNNEQLPQYIYRHLQDVKVHIKRMEY